MGNVVVTRKMLMVKESVVKNGKTPQVMKVKAYNVLLSTSRTEHLFTFRSVSSARFEIYLLLIWFQSQDLGYQAHIHRKPAAAEARAGSS
jgi:hypothetical protein